MDGEERDHRKRPCSWDDGNRSKSHRPDNGVRRERDDQPERDSDLDFDRRLDRGNNRDHRSYNNNEEENGSYNTSRFHSLASASITPNRDNNDALRRNELGNFRTPTFSQPYYSGSQRSLTQRNEEPTRVLRDSRSSAHLAASTSSLYNPDNSEDYFRRERNGSRDRQQERRSVSSESIYSSTPAATPYYSGTNEGHSRRGEDLNRNRDRYRDNDSLRDRFRSESMSLVDLTSSASLPFSSIPTNDGRVVRTSLNNLPSATVTSCGEVIEEGGHSRGESDRMLHRRSSSSLLYNCPESNIGNRTEDHRESSYGSALPAPPSSEYFGENNDRDSYRQEELVRERSYSMRSSSPKPSTSRSYRDYNVKGDTFQDEYERQEPRSSQNVSFLPTNTIEDLGSSGREDFDSLYDRSQSANRSSVPSSSNSHSFNRSSEFYVEREGDRSLLHSSSLNALPSSSRSHSYSRSNFDYDIRQEVRGYEENIAISQSCGGESSRHSTERNVTNYGHSPIQGQQSPSSIGGYVGRGRGGYNGRSACSSSAAGPSRNVERVRRIEEASSRPTEEPEAGRRNNSFVSDNRGGGNSNRADVLARLQSLNPTSSTEDVNDPKQQQSSRGRGGGRGWGRGRGGGRGGGGRKGKRPRPTDAQMADFVHTRPIDPATNQPMVKKVPLQNSKVVNLVANYYPLVSRNKWTLYHYHVDFPPEVGHTFEKRCLFKPHQAKFGFHIFNGDALYTSQKLTQNNLRLSSEREGRGKGKSVKIEIRINHNYTVVEPSDPVNIQIYNILIRDCMRRLNLEEMGRHYYNSDKKTSFHAHQLEIWPGYKTSLRQHEHSLLLCVEMTNKVFQLQNVRDFMKSCERNYKPKEKIKNELLGCIVMTVYNRKTYRIDDINWDENPTKKFSFGDKNPSLADYILDRYGKKVKDLQQPILYSRASRKEIRRGLTKNIALIPELCLLTGLREDQRKNPRLMETLSSVLQLSPTNRVNHIKGFSDILTEKNVEKDVLRPAGLKLGHELVTLQGRVLPREKVFVGEKGTIEADMRTFDWLFSVKTNSLAESVHLNTWTVIYVQGQQFVDKFIDMLHQQGQQMKFNINRQPSKKEAEKHQFFQQKSILQHIDSEMRLHSKTIQMILVILPTNSEYLYGEIKRKCCEEWGVPSQCVLGKQLIATPKKLKGVVEKLTIQIGAKLGAIPWKISVPHSGLMVIGYSMSTTGRGRGGAMGRSVGALVASTNTEQTKYFSTIVDVDRGQNLSSILGQKVILCLDAYSRMNDCLPEQIIFYRDGVGDGQLEAVNNTEVSEIQRAYTSLYEKAKKRRPRFGFIVVNKRINTKFFKQFGTEYSNPEPGTVVDDIVTLCERYDFYLISTNGTGQGTVSPTSYNILKDEMELQPKEVQHLTFKLCHMYFNWTSTVSVPAVCRYAHKLAFLQNRINKAGRGAEGGSDGVQKLCHSLFYL